MSGYIRTGFLAIHFYMGLCPKPRSLIYAVKKEVRKFVSVEARKSGSMGFSQCPFGDFR